MKPQFIRVPADGSEPEMADEPAEIHVDRDFGGVPGQVRAVAVEIPAPWDDDGAAKDVMMELPKKTGRQWDDVADAWQVKLKDLNTLVRQFVDAEYEVTVDISVAKEFESYSRSCGTFLPEHRD